MPDEATNLPAETESMPTGGQPASDAAAEAAKPASGEAPAAKPKKEKPPALEDKPFADFITQDYMPSLKRRWQPQGLKIWI